MAELEHDGMMIDGLYIPPVGFFGFRHLGEDVWGPNAFTKWKRLQCRIEGTQEHRAVIEMLHYRAEEALRGGSTNQRTETPPG